MHVFYEVKICVINVSSSLGNFLRSSSWLSMHSNRTFNSWILDKMWNDNETCKRGREKKLQKKEEKKKQTNAQLRWSFESRLLKVGEIVTFLLPLLFIFLILFYSVLSILSIIITHFFPNAFFCASKNESKEL